VLLILVIGVGLCCMFLKYGGLCMYVDLVFYLKVLLVGVGSDCYCLLFVKMLV